MSKKISKKYESEKTASKEKSIEAVTKMANADFSDSDLEVHMDYKPK